MQVGDGALFLFFRLLAVPVGVTVSFQNRLPHNAVQVTGNDVAKVLDQVTFFFQEGTFIGCRETFCIVYLYAPLYLIDGGEFVFLKPAGRLEFFRSVLFLAIPDPRRGEFRKLPPVGEDIGYVLKRFANRFTFL